MSLDDKEIPLAAHIEWFQTSLAKTDRAILIVLSGENPIGFVRFDILDNTAVVSIALAPNARGKGLAKSILLHGLTACPFKTTRFIAQIKCENAASLALFTALGFRHLSTKNNIQTFELKREIQ